MGTKKKQNKTGINWIIRQVELYLYVFTPDFKWPRSIRKIRPSEKKKKNALIICIAFFFCFFQVFLFCFVFCLSFSSYIIHRPRRHDHHRRFPNESSGRTIGGSPAHKLDRVPRRRRRRRFYYNNIIKHCYVYEFYIITSFGASAYFTPLKKKLKKKKPKTILSRTEQKSGFHSFRRLTTRPIKIKNNNFYCRDLRKKTKNKT